MTMKKLFIYLFIMTAGLLSATQVSAQKEIAPEVIKLQKGEIESTGTLLCRGFLSSPADGDSFSKQWSTHGTCNTPPDYNLTAARMNEASFCRKQSNMKSMSAR